MAKSERRVVQELRSAQAASDDDADQSPRRSAGGRRCSLARRQHVRQRCDATELRIIARAYRVFGDPRYRDSFERGSTIFSISICQRRVAPAIPLQENYGRYITFNDNAMTDNMTLLKDIIIGKPDFSLYPKPNAQLSGIVQSRHHCIFKCQVVVERQLTVWCQQHDEVTFEPRGRGILNCPAYAGEESADIGFDLMRIRTSRRCGLSRRSRPPWLGTRSEILGKRWVVMRGTGLFPWTGPGADRRSERPAAVGAVLRCRDESAICQWARRAREAVGADDFMGTAQRIRLVWPLG